MIADTNLNLPIFLKLLKKIYEDKNFYLKKYKDKFYLFSKKYNFIVLISTLDNQKSLHLTFLIDNKIFKSQYFNIYLEDNYAFSVSNDSNYVITFIEKFCNHTIFSALNEFNIHNIMDLFTKYNISDCVPFYFYLNGKVLEHFKMFSFRKNEYILVYQNKVYYGLKRKFSNFVEQDVHNIPYNCIDFFNRNNKFLNGSNIFFYNDENYKDFAFLTNNTFSIYNKENLLLLNKEKIITFSYNNSIESNKYEIEKCFLKHMSNMIVNNYAFKSELLSKNIIKKTESVKHEHIKMIEMIMY